MQWEISSDVHLCILDSQLFVRHLSIIRLFMIGIKILYTSLFLCDFIYLFVTDLFASHSSHWCVIFRILFFLLVVFVPYMVVFQLCSGHLFSLYFVC